MDLLKSKFHLIAIDLPGMGASSPIGQKPTVEIYAKAAASVTEHFGGVPIVACGHHTGGVVAMELAASRPELVSSLVLSSTPWIEADARAERSKKTPIDTITPSRDGSHLMDLWQQRSPYYPDKVEFMDRFISSALQAEWPADGHNAVSRYKMENAAPKISCPVLLVEHTNDPFASKYTSDLKTAISHAKVEYIPEGKVALEVTAPHFAEVLDQWISNPNKRQRP